MQGSFGDAREKLRVKKKDNETKKVHKADRNWRDRRRHRHENDN